MTRTGAWSEEHLVRVLHLSFRSFSMIREELREMLREKTQQRAKTGVEDGEGVCP